MTRHLSDIEFVDLVDGTLQTERAAHLETCGQCRATADAVQSARSAAAADDIPEPSPLFWEHFSARVRAAVEREADEAGTPVRTRFSVTTRWAGLATAAALVLAVVLLRPTPPTSPVGPTSQTDQAAGSVDRAAADEPFEEMEADEAWAVVRSVADQLGEDDINAAGMGTRPGSAERVADALSESERVELARLIEREIRSLGETVPSS